MTDEPIKRKRGRPRKVRPEPTIPSALEPKGLPCGSKYEITRRDGSKELRKVPWTRAIVEKMFPMVEIFPEDTLPLTWNGVTYNITEGQTISVPQPHADIYRRFQRNKHAPKAGVMIIDGQAIVVRHGAGGLGEDAEPI